MSTERREAVRQFYNKWLNKGKEDEDDRSFWIDFLQQVLGIADATDRIEFQKKVVGPDGNTKRIDAYIPETKVLIEQKSLNIDLSKPQQGHDGMTPYEQAKMYDNSLPVSEKARWIILSNFAEIWVYDMDTKKPEPVKFMLSEIPNKFSAFDFLADQRQQVLHNKEMEVSVKAGEFVGLLYDALHKEYINPDSEESLKSLNMLCVRLVFCLYAEDALIFGNNGHMFHDYMAQYETKDMRKALIELFKVLDTKIEDRDPYDNSDAGKFPYANGGLFAKEDIEIPNFTEEIRDILLNKASEGFDWSAISPTIFGAVFESTLNPETRRSQGMHYTSIENIHKVIDPLFLDELKEEYKAISEIRVEKTKKSKLEAFQDKLSKLTFLDPACGSGNFLTETYLSLRRLENLVIRDILDCDRKQVDGQIVFGAAINPIKVGIEQFYGIEINDFAVTVGKTALWIAESQMMKETEDIIAMSLDFLPLKTNANIHEGNALRIEWKDIIAPTELSYLCGNPPFIGNSRLSVEQIKDRDELFSENGGDLDYVCCWYEKAALYMEGTPIRAAFVSTNSICQGQQVYPLWKHLFDKGIHIDFAYTTFVWDSEASSKAHVYCIIVGFSMLPSANKKLLFTESQVKEVDNINAYLIPSDNIFVSKTSKPLAKNVPMVIKGFQPTDNGNLVLSDDEKKEICEKYPEAEKWIRPFISAKEYLYRKKRWCFWLNDATPTDINSIAPIRDRVRACREWRLAQKQSGDAYKLRDTPHMLRQNSKFKECDFVVMPRVSGEKRIYIPFGYVKEGAIPGDSIMLAIGADKYHFGVLSSNVHMAWTKAICGRLKGDYRYSSDIVYNNFPWPSPTEEQKRRIELTAQAILDARALYPSSSYDELYEDSIMPIELRRAHIANDKAVMQAYGFNIKDTSALDCVAKLMQMYKELIEGNNK